MEAKTPTEFFEEILPKKFKSDKAIGLDITIQVNIAGVNGGKWIVSIKDQKLEVTKGTHPSPKLSLEMAEKDYLDLVNGRISGEKAFIMGKLRFRGNVKLALKLRETGFL